MAITAKMMDSYIRGQLGSICDPIGDGPSMSDEQIRADHQRRLAGMVSGANVTGSVAYAPKMVVDTVAIRKFAIDLTWKHAPCAKNAVEEAELLVQYIINGKPSA